MRTLNVFIKEMKQYLSDIKLNILIYLVMPIIIASLYGIMYKSILDPNRTIPKFTIGYIDYDNSSMSKPLISIFKSKKLSNIVMLEEMTSEKDVKNSLTNGNFDVTIIIPKDFSHNILNGKNSSIQVLKSASGGINTDIAESIVKGYVNSLNTNRAIYSVLAKNIKNIVLTQKIYNEALPKIIVILNEKHVVDVNFNKSKKTDSKQEFAISMLVMFSLFVALKQAANTLKEKKDGTFERIKSASKNMGSFYSGKLIAIGVMSIIQISFFIILTSLITGVKWGNILLVALIVLIHSISIAAITALLISFFKSQKLMTAVSMLIIMGMSMFSGAFYPSEYMSGNLKTISNLTINHLIQSCYKNVMLDNGFTSINGSLGILSLVCIAFIIVASIKLKFSE